MVSQTRPPPHRVVAPRDTTIASVWEDLNRVGLRIGTIAGFCAAVAYLALFAWTGSHSFLVSGSFGGLIGLSGVIGQRRGRDMEIVLVTACAAAISSTPMATPVGRGGLWAAIAVITTVGALLLPDHKQFRFMVFIGVLLGGQLLWPVFGFASLADALANVVVSVTCTVAGVAVVRFTKKALDHSEATRIEIFRSVPVGLFRCSPSGEIIDANPAFASMLRSARPADIFGCTIASFHVDPREWTDLANDLQATDEARRFAHRMQPLTGAPMWVRGYAQAVRSDDGETIYLEGSVEDVTQRRETEEFARVTADRFRNVFERVPIAIWEEDHSAVGTRLDELRTAGVTDLREYLAQRPDEVADLIASIEFIDVNPAGVALLGASDKAEALRGLDSAHMPSEVAEGFVAQFEAIWDDRDSMTIEIRGATLEGRATDLALSWAVARTAQGDLDLGRVIIAIQDIAMIRQAERDLAALVKSKDDLVASVSHELRTPITAILGIAFELRDNIDTFDPPEVRDLVAIIADQSRELSNIVQDLLVAASSDAGTLSVRPEVVNLTTELGLIVPPHARGPVVDVHRPVLAWADPLRFRQILRNLVTNASKYGGPNVTITASSDSGVVRVCVVDDGAGIPAAERERVFEPYHRSQADRALPGSFGLGLPVSRRLARLMGGDLTYRFDGTSSFELSLPAAIRGHFL